MNVTVKIHAASKKATVAYGVYRARYRIRDLSRVNLARLIERAKTKLAWKIWARHEALTMWGIHREQSERDPWKRKAAVMATCWHLRSLDLKRPRTARKTNGKYPTFDWISAGKRMWHQFNNRRRRHEASGWKKWAWGAANNAKKRYDAKIAASGQLGDHQHSRLAGEAELQVRS